MLIKSFFVFHNFVYPLNFEVDFSKVDMKKLASNSGVFAIMGNSQWKDEPDFHFPEGTEKEEKYEDINTFYKVYKRLFSKYFLKSERNLRIFLSGPKIKDTDGTIRDSTIIALVDRRGFMVLTFRIDYDYKVPKSSEEIINELYNPHKEKDRFILPSAKSQEGEFEIIAKYYAEHIEGFFKKECRISKEKELLLSQEELYQYSEPYAISVINHFITRSKQDVEEKIEKNEILKILFWDDKLIEEFRPESVMEFYKEVSRTNHEIILFSAESTLLVNLINDENVKLYDSYYLLANIELLLIQKLVLQIYDHILDSILHEIRRKTYNTSTITDIRKYISRDLEEFFDIRIKMYQRGREITDAGRKILNLDQFYQEVRDKINTLDTVVSVNNNLYLQRMIALLTGISVLAFFLVSTFQLFRIVWEKYLIIAIFVVILSIILANSFISKLSNVLLHK